MNKIIIFITIVFLSYNIAFSQQWELLPIDGSTYIYGPTISFPSPDVVNSVPKLTSFPVKTDHSV
jgi:hypothetical protein